MNKKSLIKLIWLVMCFFTWCTYSRVTSLYRLDISSDALDCSEFFVAIHRLVCLSFGVGRRLGNVGTLASILRGRC